VNRRLPLRASGRTADIGIADQVEEHEPGWNAVQAIQQISVRQAIGVLIELLRPVIARRNAQTLRRLGERGSDPAELVTTVAALVKRFAPGGAE
jgi:hypothetical protein